MTDAETFGTQKQIAAGDLSVGYVDAGPADGVAVLLLHGWPYDIHSFIDVAPLLASAGYRVIVSPVLQSRLDLGAYGHRGGTARVKSTAGGNIDGPGYLALEDDLLSFGIRIERQGAGKEGHRVRVKWS